MEREEAIFLKKQNKKYTKSLLRNDGHPEEVFETPYRSKSLGVLPEIPYGNYCGDEFV
jgi:hypothetical protein